jgi:stringent starvation protein B
MAWLRSYLVRSTYQWIVDHSMTPYVLVDAFHEGVSVPEAYTEDGQIVLNLAPFAIRDLLINDEGIYFDASFSGQAFSIAIPHAAVISLYSKESGQGLYADEEQGQWGLFVNELDEETNLPEPVSYSKTSDKDKDKDSNSKEAISQRLAKSGLKVVK